MFGLRWYAVYTRPHKERMVAVAFERSGFTAYPPVVQHRSGARPPLGTPIYKQYLFVKIDLSVTPLDAIISIPGVERIVRSADGLWSCTEAQMDIIRYQVEKGVRFHHPAEPAQILHDYLLELLFPFKAKRSKRGTRGR